jgi:hypothetical protein
MGTANHKNMILRIEYLERTRRPGLLFDLLIQLNRLLGFTRVAYSIPEVHELHNKTWHLGGCRSSAFKPRPSTKGAYITKKTNENCGSGRVLSPPTSKA